jgi:putative ABC transport system permease protein
LLALAASGLGYVAGIAGVRIFDAALVPAVKPPYIDFSIDGAVIAYLAAITAAATILAGLAPALQLFTVDLTAGLREGSSAAGRGRRFRLLSALLVVTEVSLAVLLLAGAGLMIRSLLNTSRADIGVDTANVLSTSLNLRATKYPRFADQVAFQDRLKARLESLPGIEVVDVASDLPAESPDDFAYEIDGSPRADSRNPSTASGLIVGRDYFRALGVSPRAGGVFTEGDRAGSQPVVIVNERFARQSWAGRRPIGQRLRLVTRRATARGSEPPGPWLTVVGVVPDILQDDESFELAPVLYFPFHQRPENGVEILIRTRVPPATLGNAIRTELQAIDEDLAVPGLRTLEESLWLRNWRYRVFGTMFAIFAAIALLLASVGLYAVVSHSVSQRTREIGVRIALGAAARDILGLVFKQGMLQICLGLTVGIAAAGGVTRVLGALLVGVEAADPLTFAVVTLMLACAGALGCAIPAQRATRVDPLVALRNE